jgi:hypothetical protein
LRLQVLNRTLLLLLWCATGESGVDSYISCGYDLIEVIVATLTPRYAVVMFEFTRWPPSGLIGVQSGVVNACTRSVGSIVCTCTKDLTNMWRHVANIRSELEVWRFSYHLPCRYRYSILLRFPSHSTLLLLTPRRCVRWNIPHTNVSSPMCIQAKSYKYNKV